MNAIDPCTCITVGFSSVFQLPLPISKCVHRKEKKRRYLSDNMLVPKQWGRGAALALLILIGLFLFEILQIAEPYKQLVDDIPSKLSLKHAR